MVRLSRVMLGVAGVALAGCAGEGALTLSASTPPGLGPVPPSELVSADGVCPEAPAEAAKPAKLDFGLTECQVLGLIAPVDKVEIGETGGVRVATMVSLAGARPGTYRFEAGRLKALEGVPEAEKKPKPRR